ncbi:MarR family winged helix-turn-helix transcriptional regulator [Spirosoma flavum]|uniref:MarR family winged helix-turn-helix transcriptional regulator n=1 Tax=Spirosoma flavum TaxID=2048557 RepID=A0ABW6AK02_9BACT
MSEVKAKDLKARIDERLGDRSIFMINQVGHLIARKANRELNRLGFTLQIEQLPMLFITYFTQDELLSQQEIANLLQRDKSGIQRSIRTLERDGYLRVVPDSIDRRKNLIQMTPAGKLVVEKVIETAGLIDQQVTSHLTVEERETFLRTMRKIANLLEE